MSRFDDLAAQVAGYDPSALPVRAAQDFLARFVAPVETTERVALREALGRVLAEDIASPIDVPAHDNSAMDGYAFQADDLLPDRATELRIVGTALAGPAWTGTLACGDAVRIMTGAVMPAGLDTVVPQEFCRVEGDRVILASGVVRRGDNRRLRGEDLAQGRPALRAGRVITPADLGLLASLAQAEVPVRRRVRVAFFSTGDELRSIGEPLDPGCVYDSNRYTIWGMLGRLGVERIDLGVVRDDPQALEAAFRQACECADAVITSGGVSVGEADHTKQVMASLGEVAFWKIAMRPGRPMAVGHISSRGHRALLFGLPGNPVAVMVTFYAFVRDALLRLGGAEVRPLPRLRAACVGGLRKKPGRTEYQRGILEPAPDGGWQVRITGSQGSGVLRSMSEAQGLVVLEHERGDVAPGELVDVLPFEGLV